MAASEASLGTNRDCLRVCEGKGKSWLGRQVASVAGRWNMGWTRNKKEQKFQIKELESREAKNGDLKGRPLKRSGRAFPVLSPVLWSFLLPCPNFLKRKWRYYRKGEEATAGNA
jgi:hypothetical protein